MRFAIILAVIALTGLWLAVPADWSLSNITASAIAGTSCPCSVVSAQYARVLSYAGIFLMLSAGIFTFIFLREERQFSTLKRKFMDSDIGL